LGTSTRFNFGGKRLMQICFGQHSYGGPNVISRAIAYAKLFSRSYGAVIRADDNGDIASMPNSSFGLRQPRLKRRVATRALAGSTEITASKEATEWPPNTIQVI